MRVRTARDLCSSTVWVRPVRRVFESRGLIFWHKRILEIPVKTKDMAAQAPVLWQFAISHYAEKARWALDHKHVPHIRRSLLPGPHLSRIKKMTGQTA